MSLGLRLGGRIAALVAAIGLVLVAATPAWAHSELERSDPPNGGMVAEGRTSLTLWFTESVNIGASTFDLRTTEGAPVDVAVAKADGGFVELKTESLPKDLYQLDWAVLSADDGHPTRGSLLFGAGIRPAWDASVDGSSPEIAVLLVRWIDLVALMLAIGALAVSGRVIGSLGDIAGTNPRRRARRIAAFSAGTAVVAGLVTPFVRTPRGGASASEWLSSITTTMTDTTWGQLWLLREACLLVTTVAVVMWATRPAGPRYRAPVATVALLVAVGLESWAGHASTLPSNVGIAAAAAAAHVGAAGVWAGGLAVLALCLVPTMRKNPDSRGPILASVWRTYSPMAAVAAVVLLATGLYETGRHVPDLGSAASTTYGGAVAAKVVLMGVALALAGVNTMLVNPEVAAPVGRVLRRPVGWSPLPLRRFTTLVVVEVLVLAAAVGVAALLTSVPTSRDVALTEQASAPQSSSVDGLFVTFETVAAGPGKTRLIVRASSIVKTEQSPVNGVQVVLVGATMTPESVALEEIEPGRFEAEIPAPAPGEWNASVAMQRIGLPDAVMQVGWTVTAAEPSQTTTLGMATSGAAAVLLVGLLGAVVAVRRRRRETDEQPVPVLEMTETRR